MLPQERTSVLLSLLFLSTFIYYVAGRRPRGAPIAARRSASLTPHSHELIYARTRRENQVTRRSTKPAAIVNSQRPPCDANEEMQTMPPAAKQRCRRRMPGSRLSSLTPGRPGEGARIPNDSPQPGATGIRRLLIS